MSRSCSLASWVRNGFIRVLLLVVDGCGSGDEVVAGLVDGVRDVGAVNGFGRRDGDRAGGEVDVDGLDAVDGVDLASDRVHAVLAGHSGDRERGRADEAVRGVVAHRILLTGWWVRRWRRRPPGRAGETAGIRCCAE